jgi:hypothetical protein
MKQKIRKRDSAVMQLLKELENLDPNFFNGEFTQLIKKSRIIGDALRNEKKQMQKAYNDGFTTLTAPNFNKYFKDMYNEPTPNENEDPILDLADSIVKHENN